MSLLSALLASPPSTPLSRYTTMNGVLYLVLGVSLFAWPNALTLLGAEVLEGRAEGLARLCAFMLALIGWFYVMGARTRADSFSLATVVDRAFIPAVLLPLMWWNDVDAALAVPFSILDPALALGAYVIWRKHARA